MRKALYRTYRPVKFSEMVGQDHVRTILRNQVNAGEVGHAYLFTGPKGTGKTSVARILARAVNCIDLKDGEPCGKCEMCVAFDHGQMMDLIEIDAASNRSIDNIRELISKVSLAPSQGKYKVYVIDEAHQLTKEAANALLKTLEEPPSHVIFVLATTEADKLPATLVSRCQRFDFRHLSSIEISDWLAEVAKREKINIDREAIDFIASQAAGGMRDALSWLDQSRLLGDKVTKESLAQGFGFVDFAEMSALTNLVIAGDALGAINKLDALYGQGFDLGRLTTAWAQLVRQMLAVKLGNANLADLTNDQKNTVTEMVKDVTVNQIIEWLGLLMTAMKDAKSAMIPQLPLEIVIVKVASSMQHLVSSEEEKGGGAKSQVSSIKKDPDTRHLTPDTESLQEAAVSQTTVADNKVVKASSAVGWPDNIGALWGKVVANVRSTSPTLGAVVASAQPEFGEDGLVLKFGQQFHKQKVEQAKSLEMIHTALLAVGVECKVRCALDEATVQKIKPVDLSNIGQIFEISS